MNHAEHRLTAPRILRAVSRTHVLMSMGTAPKLACISVLLIQNDRGEEGGVGAISSPGNSLVPS